MNRGMSTEEIHELCYIDRWFLLQLRELLDVEGFLSITKLSEVGKDNLYEVKKKGFSDRKISFATKSNEKDVCARRIALGVDRKSTRLNSSHLTASRMPSSA